MASLPKVEEGHFRVVFDLDGTLAEDAWPSPRIGKVIPKGERMLRHYSEAGYEVAVYTARPRSHRLAIWNWLRENDLEHLVYDVVTDKPVAGLYIDDRAFNPKGFVETEVYVHASDCKLTKKGVCDCDG